LRSTVKAFSGVDDPDRAADAAIARVLGAEREARDAVERARLDVSRIAEEARADARAVAGRTERRIRTVAQAYGRELARRLAAIDAQGAALAAPDPLTERELETLRQAVAALARELAGGQP
jgi:transcription initiation factor TFIIIB Brf1 subunit/transcription initiation factor TFIIB